MVISHALYFILACGRNTIRITIPRHLYSTVAIIGYYLGRPLLTLLIHKLVCVTCIEGKSTVDAVRLLLRILLSQCQLGCFLLFCRVNSLISRENVMWTQKLQLSGLGITHKNTLATIATVNHATVVLHVDGAINDIHLAVVQLQCCRSNHASSSIHTRINSLVTCCNTAVYIILHTVYHTVVGRFSVHIVQCHLLLVL